MEYAGLTTLICLVAGYPVAYLIGRASPGRRTLLLMLVMVPFWTSFLIRTYAWITILKQEGVLNGLLKWIGLIPRFFPEPLQLLYTPAAVILGLVYAYLPFMILPIFGSVEKLDAALLEAALDLGANPWRAFWNVIFPLTRPGIGAGVLLVFVPAIGMFAVTALLGGGKVLMVGDVIANQYGQAHDLPFGAALGMALLAILGVAYAIASGRSTGARGRAGQELT
jgi:spermidine/putrescine transport system permease protein